LGSGDPKDHATGLYSGDFGCGIDMKRQLAWIGWGILLLSSGRALAQVPEEGNAKILQVLPEDAAHQVIQTLDEARRHRLPVTILQRRAVELSAKGVGADRIVEALADCTERFNLALTALERGRSTQPTGEEIEAGATALRSGMDTATLSGFARSAPGNRSLALPLLMVASLTDHNVPTNTAVSQVLSGLVAGKSDQELATLASADSGRGYQTFLLSQRPVPFTPARPNVKRGPGPRCSGCVTPR